MSNKCNSCIYFRDAKHREDQAVCIQVDLGKFISIDVDACGQYIEFKGVRQVKINLDKERDNDGTI